MSGRGGIDLSVGAIVSLTGMIFGFAYGQWDWPLLAAVLLAVVAGGSARRRQRIPGGRIGFPALIATLATYYAFGSLALVDQRPGPDRHRRRSRTSTPHAVRCACRSSAGYIPTFPLAVHLPAPDAGGRVADPGPRHVRAAALCRRDQRRRRALVRHRRHGHPDAAYVLAGGHRRVWSRSTSPPSSPPPGRTPGTSGNGLALPAITDRRPRWCRHHRRHRPGGRGRARHAC